MEDISSMSVIILHEKDETNWHSLGLGPLTEAISPMVTRERNGIYELTFQYPVSGKLFKELKSGFWIVADAGPTQVARSQRFEIARITKPINGIVTVYCEHYRYKLLRSIVKIGTKFTGITAQAALNQLGIQMEPKSDFSFYSDVVTKSSIDFSDPSKFQNAQAVLGGVSGSILDNFGGEYLFDNHQVKLLSEAGKRTNIVIAYGKNLTDISQEESIESTYTSVYGWAKTGTGENEKLIILPEIYIDSDYVHNYSERRIQMVDFSDNEPKDVDALRSLVKSYIKNNRVGIPKVSIQASYVDLASSTMDEQLKNLEMIDLCDWITITFNQLNINTSAQIIKTVWNVALDRYESIGLGDARTDFARIISESKNETEKIIEKVTWLDEAQKEASDIIKNPGKGHVVIYPSLADPQEFLIMDTTDVKTAKDVWRWNDGGLGFSSTGYNGTYGLAMTSNGAIVADRITAGTLRAIDIIGVAIRGSSIVSENGDSQIVIDDGAIKNLWKGNLFSETTGGAFRLFKSNGKDVLGGLYRTFHEATNREYLNLSAYPGTDLWLGRYDRATDGHIGSLKVDGNTGEISLSQTTLATDMNGDNKAIRNIWLTGLKVPNNSPVNFYSSLNMNGYPILNQSDIRLKENIVPSEIDGIEETKKLNFVEFNRKQGYQNKNKQAQPNKKRELGLIAQYTPFLCSDIDQQEDNYLRIDVNKQIMLNSLTNKQLIQKIEVQEKRIKKLEKIIEGIVENEQ